MSIQPYEHGTVPLKPFDFDRYIRRVYAETTRALYGISSNYSHGWCAGECDFY